MTAISGILANVPLLSQLGPSELEVVGSVCERVSFKAGDEIIRENELADSAYYLISGDIDNLPSLSDGDAAPVRIPHGATLLELAMIVEIRASATCIARSTVRMLRIQRSGIRTLLADNPGITEAMTATLTTRLNEMATTMREASRPFDELKRSA
jgi:CRP-like cAMP-binding protein